MCESGFLCIVSRKTFSNSGALRYSSYQSLGMASHLFQFPLVGIDSWGMAAPHPETPIFAKIGPQTSLNLDQSVLLSNSCCLSSLSICNWSDSKDTHHPGSTFHYSFFGTDYRFLWRLQSNTTLLVVPAQWKTSVWVQNISALCPGPGLC